MTHRAGRRQRLAITLAALAILVSAVTIGLGESPADAHTPHDSITGLAFSPDYARDGKVYVISSNRLLVSTNGKYPWKPLVRGLPHPPEDGKSLGEVTISESDPDVIYVSSRIGGVFRSDNGGASFSSAVGAAGERRQDVTAIEVSPTDPNTVLAGGSLSGFFRTVDGGAHWTAFPQFKRVAAIAFVPGTQRAVIGDDRGQVWTSADNGATWQKAGASAPAGISSVTAATEADGGAIFAGTTRGGLLRSLDGGKTFVKVGKNLPLLTINSLALSPDFGTDRTLWATSVDTGVYQSTDDGDTWTRNGRGLTTDLQAHVVHVSEFRNIVAAKDSSGNLVRYAGGFDGLFRSDGRGRWKSVETLSDYIVGLDVSPDYSRDKTVAVAGYVKGAYLSTNDGETWKVIDHGLEHEISSGNKFAPVKRLHNITFSPDYAEDDTIFSATWDHFLKSTDRGNEWKTIEVGPAPPTPLLRQFVLGVSPTYSKDKTLFLGTRQGAVYRSDDAGDSWEQVGNLGMRVRSFAIDPAYPKSSVLYAGTANGVFKSTDRGATWKKSGPAAGETNVAISPDYPTDGTLFAGTPSGLFVTRDQGETWIGPSAATLSAGAPFLPRSWIEAVAVSPAFAADKTVLVSVGGLGLYRSTDGGNTFEPVGKDLLDDNEVIADFTNPSGAPLQFSPAFAEDRTVFAYSNQDVLRSRDAGDSWDVIRIPSGADYLKTVDPTLLHAGGLHEAQSANGAVADDGIDRNTAVTVAAIVAGVLLLLVALIGGLWWRRRHAVHSKPNG